MPRRASAARNAERLVLVSHRAPVEVEMDGGTRQYRRTIGGLATALDDALRTHGGVWIAWAGLEAPDLLKPAATGLGYPIRCARLSAEEQVLGRSRSIHLQLLLDEPTMTRLLGRIGKSLGGTGIRYWATPVAFEGEIK